MTPPRNLQRRLGTTDAVVIGLGSMIGAGMFAVFGPAARAAGPGLLLGLLLAGAIAFCNATSSAQLAAQYPRSGGAYVYGRERLGAWAGFLAGSSFVLGKTASCAAMALAFAAYVAPPGAERPVAVVAVAGLAAVNYRGITRTAFLTRVIVGFVLVCLVVTLVFLWTRYDAGSPAPVGGWTDIVPGSGGWGGLLQSAALLFFAFAGYARIATMAEEVKDPARTIPRAIGIALPLVVLLYTVVAVTLLALLGPHALAGSTAPWADAVDLPGGAGTGIALVVRAAAAAACLGALLALLAGVGRTSLAMARERDLPMWLAAVHPRFAVPHRAEVLLAVVVCVLVLSVDLGGAIGFSSFGVLLYYGIANLSALTQSAGHRRYPRVLQVLGGMGCLVLAAALPWASVAAGVAVLVLWVAGRAVRLWHDRRTGIPGPTG